MKIDLIQSIKVPIELIENNTGQIPGVNSNPREMTEMEYKKLKKSLKRDANMTAIQELKLFPFNGKWVAIGGNMRLHAMRELGWKEVIAKPIPADTDVETLNRYILLDNANFGKWDFDKLANEWDMSLLDDCAINIPGLGELAEEPIPSDLDAEEDDFDETKDAVEPKVKFGDIWSLGEHRLMCGDSTNNICVSKLMNGQKADMILSDPPYGMSLDTDFSSIKGSRNSIGRKNNVAGNKYKKVIGDNEDFSPQLIKTFFDNFPKCDEIFLFGADYFAEILPKKNEGSWLVWDKRKESQADAIGSEFELIWSRCKHKRRMLRHDWFGFASSQNGNDARNRVHPTQKPITLICDIIHQWGNDRINIVDLYGGSGSVLIACEQLKRKCFMMEYDEHYCDVIVARWEKLTGEKAVKIQ